MTDNSTSPFRLPSRPPATPLGDVAFACPSDTASWLDCVQGCSPEPGPELLTAWGSGWPDRWTVLRLDADEGWLACPVSEVADGLFARAESVRRMTNWHGQRHRSGIAFMSSTGRHHAFESLTEQGVLRMIDFAGPSDLVTQPFRLRWHDGQRWRAHTPDFLVVEDAGMTVVNVRPAAKVKPEDEEQWTAMTAVATRLGWRHEVVTGLVQPHGVNVDAMTTGRREVHDPLGLQAALTEVLADGPVRFGDAVAATEAPALARAVLLRMLWTADAAIDLAVRLTDRSPVRLGSPA